MPNKQINDNTTFISRPVLVGTDWWTDCDDVVAMRVLVWAEKEKMVVIVGICMNACMEYSVESLDAFLTGEDRPNVTIGIDMDATDFGGTPSYQKNMIRQMQARKSNNDCEDAVRVYRRSLVDIEGKLDIIEIGYPQVLANLLQSPGDDLSSMTGLELVTKKINKLWMMAGNWEDNGSGLENNFTRNSRSKLAGHYVCENWPTPITFLGWEVSHDILTGGTLTSPTDMVAQALRDHGSPNGRSSWDPMLILLACYGDEEIAGYNRVIGKAHVDPQTGRNSFKINSQGKHCYVTKSQPDEYYQQTIDKILEENEQEYK